MTKKVLVLLITLLFSVSTRAYEDNWNLYPSYQDCTYCQKAGKKLYILSSGALFSFNTDDNEVYLYDKLNGLSDVDIKCISYSNHIKGLVIVYNNANIDILYDDETIYNITDFKNSSIANKTINNISIDKNLAYLSTEFGVVVLDLDRLEIKNSFITNRNTLNTYLFKNKLYTGTVDGLFKCDTVKNMLDINNWEFVSSYKVSAFCELDNELYMLVKGKGIFTSDTNNNFKSVVNKSGQEYTTIYTENNEIIAPAKDKLTIIKKGKTVKSYKTTNSNYILRNGNEYWNCKGYKGVYKCEIVNNELKEKNNISVPNSPIRNFCEFMKFTNDGKLLVAGGNISYLDNIHHSGTVMEYNINNRKWFNFPEDTIKKVTNINYRNVCSVDEDPTEPGHYFAGSFGNGLYEFRDGKFVKHYSHKNSPIESAVPTSNNYTRITGVQFDKEGNLWCINADGGNKVKYIVKVLKKNGEWVSLYYKDIEYFPTMSYTLFDSRGWLWVTSLQNPGGLFCAKIKNTPFDTNDDETKLWVNKFTNQDGTTYNVYQIYSLREDKNGHLWVGTNIGLFVIDNPEEFFKDGIFKQIKVPRNDGSGFADYLMNGIFIKAIDIDGANRKWIGTLDNGVYLISEDGLETIHHFTSENSPLPSNNIESIAVNKITGEVFIGTDKGIVSYKGDAIIPKEELERDNIYAYPNPVRADYNGNISIVGLTDECNVKIIDGSGYLVNEGFSNGGMYTWNGRNIKGEKVSSGVYHVLLYDNEGKEGEVTKIVITR